MITFAKIVTDLFCETKLYEHYMDHHKKVKGPVHAMFGKLTEKTDRSWESLIYNSALVIMLFFAHVYRSQKWQEINE